MARTARPKLDLVCTHIIVFPMMNPKCAHLKIKLDDFEDLFEKLGLSSALISMQKMVKVKD